MWLLAGPMKYNWSGVTLWSMFANSVTIINYKFKEYNSKTDYLHSKSIRLAMLFWLVFVNPATYNSS